ncbi:MCP four helix bundle domain-containing protein [Hymenobacter cellulosilyticus]|uniref:MCP four helix bundle domain-containing protein n=1 Tax=Hymenobacter cellulosilyticus TaxID=2932248 RepID=A0A8T9PZL0_9BACT|nr:MCP four helix bundle domain-containing protein [Hymenobacter cellulosilyticus]UOQ70906.1 MCP four helix bundle domain-containing protein [Hymenobacter cellulosilyticus]
MNLKTKINLGFLAMLLLLLSIGGYGYYSLRQLDRNSRDVLTANLYSVTLGQQMLRSLDELARQPLTDTVATARFAAALSKEAGNITEAGEQEVVEELGQRLRVLQQLQSAAPAPAALVAAPPAVAELRRLTYQMVEVNTAALTRKTAQANRRADEANRNLLVFLTLATLLALGLVGSVPEAAVQPLRRLTAALNHATERDFSASIPRKAPTNLGRWPGPSTAC